MEITAIITPMRICTDRIYTTKRVRWMIDLSLVTHLHVERPKVPRRIQCPVCLIRTLDYAVPNPPVAFPIGGIAVHSLYTVLFPTTMPCCASVWLRPFPIGSAPLFVAKSPPLIRRSWCSWVSFQWSFVTPSVASVLMLSPRLGAGISQHRRQVGRGLCQAGVAKRPSSHSV